MHWLTTKLGRQRVPECFASAEDDQSSAPSCHRGSCCSSRVCVALGSRIDYCNRLLPTLDTATALAASKVSSGRMCHTRLHYLKRLSDRRDKLCRDSFRKLLDSSNCIHHHQIFIVSCQTAINYNDRMRNKPIKVPRNLAAISTSLFFELPSFQNEATYRYQSFLLCAPMMDLCSHQIW